MTDFDFADDIALICKEIAQAQELLSRMEKEAAKNGLGLSTIKTKVLPYHQQIEPVIKAKDKSRIKVVKNFTYLGSYVDNIEKKVKVCKTLTRSASNKLTKI